MKGERKALGLISLINGYLPLVVLYGPKGLGLSRIRAYPFRFQS